MISSGVQLFSNEVNSIWFAHDYVIGLAPEAKQERLQTSKMDLNNVHLNLQFFFQETVTHVK